MNKLVKTLSKTDLLKEFLKSLNGVLSITNKELRILQVLIDIQLGNTELDLTTDITGGVLNKYARKYIMNKLNVSPENLSRYFTKFKKLGILVPSRQYVGEYVVNKALIPEIIGDRVQIVIILKIDERNEK